VKWSRQMEQHSSFREWLCSSVISSASMSFISAIESPWFRCRLSSCWNSSSNWMSFSKNASNSSSCCRCCSALYLRARLSATFKGLSSLRLICKIFSCCMRASSNSLSPLRASYCARLSLPNQLQLAVHIGTKTHSSSKR
jgi:hypothetical protein